MNRRTSAVTLAALIAVAGPAVADDAAVQKLLDRAEIEELVARLVALNAERAAEERAGHIRWLRPDYQIPRFAPSDGPRAS